MTIKCRTIDAGNLRCNGCWELGKLSEPCVEIAFIVGTSSDYIFLCQACADELQQEVLSSLTWDVL